MEETATINVVRSPDLFKMKLGIGEDAYKSLRLGNNLSKLSGLLGMGGTAAGIASSTFVATTFFPPVWFAFGASAVTPIGWVIGAAVVSGAAYVKAADMYQKTRGKLVKVVPTFINTPLDLLAIGISNLAIPIFHHIAMADDHFHENERSEIVDYFVDVWGYDRNYIESRLDAHSGRLPKTIEQAVSEFFAFIRDNEDCNHQSIAKEIVAFMNDVALSDGFVSAKEKAAIAEIEQILKRQ
ncbi:MAG: TerB family tellurite resistance protein [Gammaproteobacteria bacterium]|nr:TerB family tellurite resistance protein [Gammaproteobacteria bacterium]